MKLSSLYPNDCTGKNQVHEWADISNDSGEAEEPVSVADFSNYARLMGFEDDGESGELPFDSDNDLISSLLIGSRQSIEAYTGRSLVAHTWAARVSGDPVLPFSNGGTITEVKDLNGNVVDPANYKVIGLDFKSVSLLNDYTVTYSVDPTCPERLKTAILAEALFRYENRGDKAEEGRLSDKSLAIAMTFKSVNSWLQ